MKFKKPSRATTTLLIVIAGFVATTMFAQKFAVAKPEDETTARLVAKLITRYHISQGKIDDKISAKMFDRYLKQLDPRKLYFTKADIDEFSKSRTILDDQIQEGNVKFAYQVFDRYRTRVGERVAMAQRLLKEKYDFQKPGDSILIDAKGRSWAATDTEIHKRWRTRVKADILSLKLSDKPMPDVLEQLRKRYVNIQRGIRQTSKIDILEIYLSSLTHAFDPHSSYMSPETVEDFEILMKLRLQGIGASLRSIDGYTVVVNIVEDGAADKDGRLKKDDKIIGVDSKADGKMIDIVEMKLSKVVRLIRGPKGTKVLLKVLKADKIDKKTGKTIAKGKTVEILLVRRIIQLKSSEVKGEIIDGAQRIGGRASRIGVINIPSFYRDFEGARLGVKNFKSTSRDVRRVLAEFRAKGPLDLLVIDLRFNGGGSLTESIEVSGLFIDKGPVVQVRRLHDQPRSHDDLDAGTSYDGPLLIICNRMSASASEIFAGVIKDYKRGIIVGDKSTHGKGTVQNVMTVGRQMFRFLKPSKRGALKLTIQQFFRVNGDSTQKRGVVPHLILPSFNNHRDIGEADLDYALDFAQVPSAGYNKFDMINPELLVTLRNNSTNRRAKSKKFAKLIKDIESYRKQKSQKSVTLNEKKFFAQRAELDADEEDKKEIEQIINPDDEIVHRDFYFDEVLAITQDYVNQLKKSKIARAN